jgi:hypothetical protein
MKQINFDRAWAGSLMAMEMLKSSPGVSHTQIQKKLFEIILCALQSAEQQRIKRERKRRYRQLRPSRN